MKVTLNLTDEEIRMAKFTRLSDAVFEAKLFLTREHFVDLVAKYVEHVDSTDSSKDSTNSGKVTKQ